jgi:hypothetical protein
MRIVEIVGFNKHGHIWKVFIKFGAKNVPTSRLSQLAMEIQPTNSSNLSQMTQ